MPGVHRTWPTGRRALLAAVVAAVGWLTLRVLSRVTRRVAGHSMRPTLEDGDLVLTLPAWARHVRAGRVVVVRDPRRPERSTVKRVAATTGRWASLPDGPGPVPRDRIAVRGDDPTASTDSRAYGPVPVDLVERHVIARLWPPRPL